MRADRSGSISEPRATGDPVCLNTDDSGVWNSNLRDEYFTEVTTFRLTWSEVVQLGRNGLRGGQGASARGLPAAGS